MAAHQMDGELDRTVRALADDTALVLYGRGYLWRLADGTPKLNALHVHRMGSENATTHHGNGEDERGFSTIPGALTIATINPLDHGDDHLL